MTAIIISLGGALISGFFGYLSHRRACAAADSAKQAASATTAQKP